MASIEAVYYVSKGLPRVHSGRACLPMQEMQETQVEPWFREIPRRRKWQPAPISCLENSTDRGASGCKESDMTEIEHICTTYLAILPFFLIQEQNLGVLGSLRSDWKGETVGKHEPRH